MLSAFEIFKDISFCNISIFSEYEQCYAIRGQLFDHSTLKDVCIVEWIMDGIKFFGSEVNEFYKKFAKTQLY